MANFMDRMYAENSQEGKRKKEEEERQYRLNHIKSLAHDVCSEIRNAIQGNWNNHHFEGYITLFVFDGNNIGFRKDLYRKPVDDHIGRRNKTYVGYLQIRETDEADYFISIIKDTMAKDGVRNFDIRKERVEVESVDPSSLLKLRQKEYDTYLFYVTIKW